MHLNLVSKDSTALPIDVDELKWQQNIDGTDDDTNLKKLIYSVRDHIEEECGYCFTDATYDQWGPSFASKQIYCLKKPVTSIVSVAYYDTDDTSQPFTDFYALLPSNTRGWIQPKESWPSTYNRPDAVTIRYTVGKGTYPDNYKHLVKIVCGSWYAIREGEITGTITTEMKHGVQRLIDEFRVSL
jgi:uncharacterized phiE125 gp8 family phage protein